MTREELAELIRRQVDPDHWGFSEDQLKGVIRWSFREIDRLRAEHKRLLQHATDSKLTLDDRTMAHRNAQSALRDEIDRLRAELEDASGALAMLRLAIDEATAMDDERSR